MVWMVFNADRSHCRLNRLPAGTNAVTGELF